MTERIEASLTGIHPRSELTVRASRDFDRGRAREQDLKDAFRRDKLELLSLERDSGFSTVSDGQITWQDFLRPFAESLGGIKLEADLVRWFDTNTFYRKPKVVGELSLPDPDFGLEERFLGDPLDWPAESKKKISLPGPFTFGSLAEDKHYGSKENLVTSYARLLGDLVRLLHERRNVSIVQLNEPSLVYRQSSSNDWRSVLLLRVFREHLSDLPVELWIHTYFGDGSRLLPNLLSLEQVSLVGIDFTKTSLSDVESLPFNGKLVGCGCVDARNSFIESPEWIARFCSDVLEALGPGGLVVLPSSDLKYLPRTYADQKLKSIGRATRLLSKTRTVKS